MPLTAAGILPLPMIGDILWTPPADWRDTTEIGRFVNWLSDERGLGRAGRGVLDAVELIGQRVRSRPARGSAKAREVGVAEHAQQISEVISGAEHARLLKHARVRVLDEVLGVLA